MYPISTYTFISNGQVWEDKGILWKLKHGKIKTLSPLSFMLFIKQTCYV